MRSDKLSQTPLKVLLKTPPGNIFFGELAKRFKLIYTGGQSLISLLKQLEEKQDPALIFGIREILKLLISFNQIVTSSLAQLFALYDDNILRENYCLH